MSNNSSFSAGTISAWRPNDRVVIVQVLVAIMLCINCLLIINYFIKDFYKNMRYILFANALFSDCINLITTNLLLILSFYAVAMPFQLCLIFFIITSLYNYVTPVTLTAMSLERYVAICMPLRHAELCTAYRALQGILFIHGLSIIPCSVVLATFFLSVTFGTIKPHVVCSVEFFILHRWQSHLRSAIAQSYFFVMCILIAFAYVQIMKVAKVASGKRRDLTQKGLKTVLLHAFQLLLCLVHLWCPFIEAAVLQIDFRLFVEVRYFNYIMFSLIPRCLIPLIYGLRDEGFMTALKQLTVCRKCNNKFKM